MTSPRTGLRGRPPRQPARAPANPQSRALGRRAAPPPKPAKPDAGWAAVPDAQLCADIKLLRDLESAAPADAADADDAAHAARWARAAGLPSPSALVAALRRGTAAEAALVARHRGLVAAAATAAAARARGLPRADGVAVAAAALLAAAPLYDPACGAAFSSYAAVAMRRRLARVAASDGSVVRLPPSARRVNAVRARLEGAALDAVVTDADVALAAGVTPAAAAAARRAGGAQAAHDDDDASDDDGAAGGAAPPPLPPSVAAASSALLARLPPKQAAAVVARFGLDGLPPRSLAAVGAALSPPISAEGASQLVQRALATLAANPAPWRALVADGAAVDESDVEGGRRVAPPAGRGGALPLDGRPPADA